MKSTLSLNRKKKIIPTGNSTNNFYSTIDSSTNYIKSPQLTSPINKNLISSNFFPQEESIEIIIPTPYPQNNFMLIEDENQLNSKYTELLNEKYPPRKHLKHNLISWMKYNKKIPHKQINVKFLNPKIKVEDYGLKKITYKGNDIENTNNIRSLEDALEIIEKLKTKIVEYELTNNQNIDSSIQCINSIKEENEFVKTKLVESYEKLNFVSHKFNIDDIEDILHNSANVIYESFRKKWLKIKFFVNLKNRFYRIKFIRFNYNKFLQRRNNILKYKAVLSLEKNHMIRQYCIKNKRRKLLINLRRILESLRKNAYLNKIREKFENMKRTIYLMVYMKELKLNLGQTKYFKTINKKALFKYYLTLTSKAIRKLKYNILKFRNKNIQNGKIQYNKFFIDFEQRLNESNSNKISDILLNKSSKIKKAKGLSCLKKLFTKIVEINNNKIINHKNKIYPLEIYFKKWKDSIDYITKEIQLKINIKNKLIHNFINKVQQKIKIKKFRVSDNLKEFYYSKFLGEINKKIEINKKFSDFKNVQKIIIYKNVFDILHKNITSEPLIRFVKLIFIYIL